VVIRRQRSRLSDHPLPMRRFALADWPGTPQEALTAWRSAFFSYWHTERYPGGLVAILAALRDARRIAAGAERFREVENGR
jgi:hypothetical protein